jgi:(2Fe-2S) ferredoxin
MGDKPHLLVSICRASECSARGADVLHQEIAAGVSKSGEGGRIAVARGGCWGLCNLGPNVVVRQDDAARAVEKSLFGHDATFAGKIGEYHYGACTREIARRIVDEHLLEGRPIRELLSDRATRATAKKLSTD